MVTKGISKSEIFDTRKRSVRRQRQFVVFSSIGCLLFVPVWGFLRLFFCWEESCTGFICWFCNLHWVITLLLIGYMAALLVMAYQLVRISIENDEELPASVEDPWIPGTRQIVNTTELISRKSRSAIAGMGKMPGIRNIAASSSSVVRGLKAIPGAKIVDAGMKGIKSSAHEIYMTGREFEHGRALCKEAKPGIGTLVATLLAFALALFMIIGPYNFLFF